MFSRRDIRTHLRARKVITDITFRQAAGKSRKPVAFLRLKGKRTHHTELLDCGGGYRALFSWRDGDIREKRCFYAWLFLAAGGADLVPIARIDYHPSHKDLHIVLNCEDERDLTNRALPGCRELNLQRQRPLDPAQELDRQALIDCAMRTLGIEFAPLDGGLF